MLDEKTLFNMVKKYAATSEGRKQIKKKTNIDYNPQKDRSKIINMRSYANLMKSILLKHINLHIKSVSADDIVIESPIIDESGVYTMHLSFRSGSVARQSLQPDMYPEGIENIVLHFTHGWAAKNYLRGDWHGQQVWSRQIRPGSSFMQRAVDEFNSKVKGIATAELSLEYSN